MKDRKYHVALSFAGEQRDFVERVAKILKDKGISVFYDEFETAEIWGKDLVEHLADVYENQAHYCVMFISKEYISKPWTTHERKSAQARQLNSPEYVLPFKFDDVEVSGMPKTISFIKRQDFDEAALANLIVKKLDAQGLIKPEAAPPRSAEPAFIKFEPAKFKVIEATGVTSVTDSGAGIYTIVFAENMDPNKVQIYPVGMGDRNFSIQAITSSAATVKFGPDVSLVSLKICDT